MKDLSGIGDECEDIDHESISAVSEMDKLARETSPKCESDEQCGSSNTSATGSESLIGVTTNTTAAQNVRLSPISISSSDLADSTELDARNMSVFPLHSDQVDCGSKVSCECIKAYMMRTASQLTSTEVDALHVAIAEMEALHPRSVLRNCELKIISGSPQGTNPVFVSGRRRNKFLIVCRRQAPPEFIVRSCPAVSRRVYWSKVSILDWLKLVWFVMSASAFLYLLFWAMDQLHLEMPMQGCLDLKMKMLSSLSPSSPHESEQYCGAHTLDGIVPVDDNSLASSLLPSAESFFQQLFKPKKSG